jgi:hypothetical protein
MPRLPVAGNPCGGHRDRCVPGVAGPRCNGSDGDPTASIEFLQPAHLLRAGEPEGLRSESHPLLGRRCQPRRNPPTSRLVEPVVESASLS